MRDNVIRNIALRNDRFDIIIDCVDRHSLDLSFHLRQDSVIIII